MYLVGQVTTFYRYVATFVGDVSTFSGYKKHLVYALRNCERARLLRSWLRIPLGHEYLSVLSVVCCQVEVPVMSNCSKL
jgi:hypothetical protein